MQHVFQKGELVWTYFETNVHNKDGWDIMCGVVETAGPKEFKVRWLRSGGRQRFRYPETKGIQVIIDKDVLEYAQGLLRKYEESNARTNR